MRPLFANVRSWGFFRSPGPKPSVGNGTGGGTPWASIRQGDYEVGRK